MVLVYLGMAILGWALAYVTGTQLAKRDVRDAWQRLRERHWQEAEAEEATEEGADQWNW